MSNIMSRKEIISSTTYNYMAFDEYCRSKRPRQYGIAFYRFDKLADDDDNEGELCFVDTLWQSRWSAFTVADGIIVALELKGNYLPDRSYHSRRTRLLRGPISLALHVAMCGRSPNPRI